MLLDEEIRTLVGAGRWQRLVGRKDVRNGGYLRRLVTSMGLVELEVPRAREGGSASEVLGRYRRRSAEIDDAITAAYVHGVSTRKMRKITEALMGEQVSRSTFSGVKLMIADAHGGLAAAARKHLPDARHQRCTVHLERNVLSKTPQSLRGRMAREASRIFDAPSAGEAKARLDQLKAGLGKQLPEAMACLVAGFAAATQFHAFPKEHWQRIRSTNHWSACRARSSAASVSSAPSPTVPARCAHHRGRVARHRDLGDRRCLDLSKEIDRKTA